MAHNSAYRIYLTIAGLDLNLAGPSQLQQSGLLLPETHGSGHKRQRTSNDDDDPTGKPQ